MLPQSTLHGQSHLFPTCSHELHVRGPRPGVCRRAHLVRYQPKRGARSCVRRDAQSFNSQSQQNSENFRDSAQEKAQAASKEASKRYIHTRLALTLRCLVPTKQLFSWSLCLCCRVRATFESVSAGVKKRAGQVNQKFGLSGKAQQTADRQASCEDFFSLFFAGLSCAAYYIVNLPVHSITLYMKFLSSTSSALSCCYMTCRLKEQFEDVDEKLQLRQKARNALLDVRRQLPQVCSATVIHVGALFVLCYNSIWQLEFSHNMGLTLGGLPVAVATTVQCLFKDASRTDLSICIAGVVLPKWAFLQASQPCLCLILDSAADLVTSGQKIWWTGETVCLREDVSKRLLLVKPASLQH